MNRRHFFKSLAAAAGATSVSPLIFIPKFEPVRWKRLALTQQMLDEVVVALDPAFPGPDKLLMAWPSKDFIGKWRWISGSNMLTDLMTPEIGRV